MRSDIVHLFICRNKRNNNERQQKYNNDRVHLNSQAQSETEQQNDQMLGCSHLNCDASAKKVNTF